MMIRVYGEPRPWPKKLSRPPFKRGGKDIYRTFTDDFRTKQVKQPDGSTKRKTWDHGYKMRWFGHVRDCVRVWMEQNDRQPFQQHHPIALGCLFFVTKAKSSKLVYPTSTPDKDNLRYGIPNMLKRTPDIKAGKIPGAYPEGVAFYDDSQDIWTANPDGILWATQSSPLGVLITIIDLLDHPDMLEWGRGIDKDICAEVVALGKEAQFG